eukprot:4494991-Pyramimonas_sp.AAC.1
MPVSDINALRARNVRRLALLGRPCCVAAQSNPPHHVWPNLHKCADWVDAQGYLTINRSHNFPTNFKRREGHIN